jgi:hypothetical protein
MPQAISTEPLAQMLKSIALQKRTGMLRIEQLGERNAEQGEVYFENGRPLRAQAGQERGKAALQRINAWKQVTCSFHGMSRPFPLDTRSLAVVSEQKAPEKPLARSLVAGVPETEKLSRMPEPVVTESLKGVNGNLAPSQRSTTQVLAAQQAAGMTVEHIRTISTSTQANQPLILHGATLEEYTPEQPARPSRAIQRWTTHIGPYPQAVEMPRKPPVTPRLDPLPGEDVLPGRMAIFKARATVSPQALKDMERRERIVFILLDGRRTIQDIARLTHQPESDVEEILVQLTQDRYTQYIRG